MNAKLLFAATVIVSTVAGLASTAAMAQDSAPATRAAVIEQVRQAAADGTLRRTDADVDRQDLSAGPTSASRAHVLAEMAQTRSAAKPAGPAGARLYNPFGADLARPSTRARADVKADVLKAAAEGTLQRTDYDAADRVATARRSLPGRAPQVTAGAASPASSRQGS